MNLSKAFESCLSADYSEGFDSANYAIQRNGTELYIYFQDSDGVEDWSVNLDFPARPYRRKNDSPWFAHKGFLESWRRTQKKLEEVIADRAITRITLVGYSHGAAIALLCHEYVYFTRPDLHDSLIGLGFGCPRVVWGFLRPEIARRWERFFVIRNLDDIVTHLPPALLGYSHAGHLIEIGERGKYSAVDAHRAENILRELKLLEQKKNGSKLPFST